VGYDSLHNTWEPRSHLSTILDVVNQFDKKKDTEEVKLDHRRHSRTSVSNSNRPNKKPNAPAKKISAPVKPPPKTKTKPKAHSKLRKIIKKPAVVSEPPLKWLTNKEIL